MLEIDGLRLIEPARYAEHGYPYEEWALLRREAPLTQIEPPGWPAFWALTKHADIIEVSKQPENFLNAPGMTLVRERSDNQEVSQQIRTIINMDPPDHRKYRQVATRFFTPRAIKALDPLVRETARKLVDGLGAEGECDFITDIASLHPLKVIARILGVPESDEPFILKLTNELFGGEDPEFQRGEDRMQAMRGLFMEFWEYFGKIMQDRRAKPRDDLASLFANARIDGEPMGELETMGYCLIAFTAGHETTRGAIGGGMQALIDNPEQRGRWAREPELTATAIDEIVRFVTPVNHMVRTAARDYVLRGQKICKGDRLVLFYASANRDEEVFDGPDELHLDRYPNRHLGFGIGEHFCLGAHLARMTSGSLFRELVSRIEYIEPAGTPLRTASNLVPGLKHMPIRYRLASAT
ncbi:MAG: cytochrome P450 [Myxococcota bacterium]|jgi:cytochrome P450|nr:cytochrome P450 [Deltaproteobacteria bacterium]MCP4242768.1 cytochrome P450 [bacterium]MDP7075290.1 cytochrome P450 [Myxococcota bacterium]MDP7299156.1 cytochrome P450 [Myxococcota bacterium]MDP7434344.1 cytochrome P450 [Myxococcota bacterium]